MINKRMILLALAFALLLAACGKKDEVSKEEVVNQIYTSVAETLAAKPTSTIMPTAMILDPATATPIPTMTPLSDNPLPMPTATLLATSEAPCHEAIYMSDVTVPDGTVFAPGETFTKTWHIFNGGSCAWEADYALSFVDGEEMGGVPSVLGVKVQPNGEGDISVTFTAPLTVGSYKSSWQLTDGSGTKFGNWIYVQITVAESTATVTETATSVPATETPTPTP